MYYIDGTSDKYYIDGTFDNRHQIEGQDYFEWRVMEKTPDGPVMLATFYGPMSLSAATCFIEVLEKDETPTMGDAFRYMPDKTE